MYETYLNGVGDNIMPSSCKNLKKMSNKHGNIFLRHLVYENGEKLWYFISLPANTDMGMSGPDGYCVWCPLSLRPDTVSCFEPVRRGRGVQWGVELCHERRQEHTKWHSGHDGQTLSCCLNIPLGHGQVHDGRLDSVAEPGHLVICYVESVTVAWYPGHWLCWNLIPSN